jgi:tetratricopeptide (TPR) repeat protein
MVNAGPMDVSPWFARRASERIEAGNTAEAARLCIDGVAEYPWYATGVYVLGKCYEELGRTAESILEYRRAVALAPDAALVREALARVERHEQGAFEAFAVQQAKALNRVAGSVGYEEYIAGEAGAAESSADFLRKQAEAARHDEARAEVEKEKGKPSVPSTRIVTVTLAEIYAAQGEYREAVEAYRVLMERRPEDAEGFQKRIRELEILAAAATEKPLE